MPIAISLATTFGKQSKSACIGDHDFLAKPMVKNCFDEIKTLVPIPHYC